MAIKKICDFCGKHIDCENHVDIEYNEFSDWLGGCRPAVTLTFCMDCLRKEAKMNFFRFFNEQVEKRRARRETE